MIPIGKTIYLLFRYPLRRFALMTKDIVRYGRGNRLRYVLTLPLIFVGIFAAQLGALGVFVGLLDPEVRD